MSITWTDDLATGSETIDQQHRELFDRINRLFEACNQGRGRGEIEKIIQFLSAYVRSHFSAEETYMEKFAYPAAAAHKTEHGEFTETFESLKRRFDEEGPGVLLVINTNQIMVDWLRTHIRRADRELGAFLKNRLAQSLPFS